MIPFRYYVVMMSFSLCLDYKQISPCDCLTQCMNTFFIKPCNDGFQQCIIVGKYLVVSLEFQARAIWFQVT